MDIAIQKAEMKLRRVSQDDESLRIYEIREKALSDWTSGVNHAKREGIKEGITKGREEIIKLLKSGKAPEEIIKD